MAAHIEALRAVVEQQRLYIGSMRASRFWRIRDGIFAFLRRFGVREDPLPVPTAEEIAFTAAADDDVYQLFRLRHRRPASDAAWLRGLVPLLAVREVVGLVLDLRGADEGACDASLCSVIEQIYPFWRVHCWLNTTDAGQHAWLRRAAELDDRVDLAPWHGEAGPDVAIGFLNAGDLLEPEALLLVAIELHAGADVVYTDEDRLRSDGVCDQPDFKPSWSPENELTRDYVGSLCALRSSALTAVGGIDLHADRACCYDALLRVTERTDRIAHIARVLYHRRESVPAIQSTDLARVVYSALARRGEVGSVIAHGDGVQIQFAAPPDERVSVIIPTRDAADLLERCLTSVFERTAHPSFEVIVVDNASVETATAELLARWADRESDRFRVIRDDRAFNYSALNNAAVAATSAPYVVLLNNDTEVIEPGWMTAMLGQARRRSIGAVGALLLYPDGLVQHAGVVLGGVLGLAGHAYRGYSVDDRAPLALRYDTNYLAVTGACLMVAKHKYEEVRGLDEAFAVAFNDVDLCLKLWRAGYRNVVVPRARLYHYESRSRGRDDTPAKRIRARTESDELRRRWPEVALADPYYNSNLTLAAEDFSLRL